MIFLDSNAVIDLMNQPSPADRGWAARLFDRYANDVGLGVNLIVVSEVAVGVQQPDVLVDDMGFSNATATATRVGSVTSMTSMVPLPALRFPDHAYFAPTPLSAPE